tara:strand:- start:72 stop:989 length:918 start_codon:yes stop_codon:yes gene_type:complete
MKKILEIVVLVLLYCNVVSAGIIKVGSSDLELPKRFFVHNWNDDFIDDFCAYYGTPLSCSVIIDKKNKTYFDDYNSGVALEDIKVLKPLFKKIKKLENSQNYESSYKSFLKLLKKTMKKQSLDLIFEYIEVENVIETFNSWNLDYDYNEIKNMSDSELSNINREIKDEIKSTFDVDNMQFNINNFIISKNASQNLFVKLNGNFRMFLLDGIEPLKIDYNLYLTEHNNNFVHFAGICLVNCSKLNSVFNEIIEKSFNTKINFSNLNNSNESKVDIIDQIKQLNELYETGVLTKEEFEKAKKRVLDQ